MTLLFLTETEPEYDYLKTAHRTYYDCLANWPALLLLTLN